MGLPVVDRATDGLPYADHAQESRIRRHATHLVRRRDRLCRYRLRALGLAAGHRASVPYLFVCSQGHSPLALLCYRLLRLQRSTRIDGCWRGQHWLRDSHLSDFHRVHRLLYLACRSLSVVWLGSGVPRSMICPPQTPNQSLQPAASSAYCPVFR